MSEKPPKFETPAEREERMHGLHVVGDSEHVPLGREEIKQEIDDNLDSQMIYMGDIVKVLEDNGRPLEARALQNIMEDLLTIQKRIKEL